MSAGLATSTFDTTGRCQFCAGIVTNIDGRRRTRDELAETHRSTCPGLTRRSNIR